MNINEKRDKLISLRKIIEQKKGQRDKTQSLLNDCKIQVCILKKERSNSIQAQEIIQKVAQETQQQLEWHISDIVTLALKSVFHNPYAFQTEFNLKRGKTECKMYFKRNGHKINPIDEAGGGVVDVAAFALRIAIWSLAKPKWRNTLVLDEPFKNINDKTRRIHKKIAKTVKMLSQKLNLQFIVITMIEELNEIADRAYEFKLKNGKTKVRKIKGGYKVNLPMRKL